MGQDVEQDDELTIIDVKPETIELDDDDLLEELLTKSADETTIPITKAPKIQKPVKRKRKRALVTRYNKKRKVDSGVSDVNNTPYSYVRSEKVSSKAIYSIKFYDEKIFAIASDNKITLYNVANDDTFEEIKTYQEVSNEGERESFYVVDWNKTPESIEQRWLAAGGGTGVLRVINTRTDYQIKLTGHTGAIQDLKFIPDNRNLIVTCSEDLTVRLWKYLKVGVQIAKFGNIEQSQDLVSLDLSPKGNSVITGSLDKTIYIWKLNTPRVRRAIETCEEEDFEPIEMTEPYFKSSDVHSGFVDSVVWLTDELFVSKSTNNDVAFWTIKKVASGRRIVQELIFFDVHMFDTWYFKATVDPSRQHLVFGNQNGHLVVFKLNENLEPLCLQNSKSKDPIRDVAFANDRLLLAVTDFGRILTFKKKKS